MKVVFFGSPQFAVEVLKSLMGSTHKIVGVVCQPDRPANRNKLTACATKNFALANQIPVYDWQSVSLEGAEDLKKLEADIFVTAAYGQMLSQNIIDIPKFGVINVHGSLLPLYRGASPIQSAILDGQSSTGVTIVKTVKKMDAGQIVLQQSIDILPEYTADQLFDKLAELGGDLIVKALNEIQNGCANYVAQDENKATYCKKIISTEEKIDWNDSTEKVVRKIKGLSSDPGAYTFFNGKRLKIFNCAKDLQFQEKLLAGEIKYTKKQMIVGCADGNILLTDVQPSEGKRMNICDFLNGLKTHPTQMDEQ